MKDFAGRIAVVTGGGSGMGRELVLQLNRVQFETRSQGAWIGSGGCHMTVLLRGGVRLDIAC